MATVVDIIITTKIKDDIVCMKVTMG
jgi:hypothetical protein